MAVMIGVMAPAVVLLHGFTHTGASWDPVVAALGERYRALAPDIRGHGSASELVPVTLEAVLDDITGLGVERFALAGYSMGGRLALHAVLALPDMVSRLVLIGASPGLADPREREARRRVDDALADEVEQMSIEAFARRWAAAPLLADQPREVLARVHADRLRNTPAGLARALRGLGTGALPSLWEELGRIAVPATLIAGERDTKFRKTAVRMAASMPHAETAVVSGAGHAVHLEAPKEVALLLGDLGRGRR